MNSVLNRLQPRSFEQGLPASAFLDRWRRFSYHLCLRKGGGSRRAVNLALRLNKCRTLIGHEKLLIFDHFRHLVAADRTSKAAFGLRVPIRSSLIKNKNDIPQLQTWLNAAIGNIPFGNFVKQIVEQSNSLLTLVHMLAELVDPFFSLGVKLSDTFLIDSVLSETFFFSNAKSLSIIYVLNVFLFDFQKAFSPERVIFLLEPI